MKRWEVLVLIVEVLVAVMLAIGIISVVGAKLGEIFSTVNGPVFQGVCSAPKWALDARSPVLVDLQDLAADPQSYQGKWVKINNAEVLHIYSPTEFTIGTPSDSIYVVEVIPDQSGLGFSIETPPPDCVPSFYEGDKVSLGGLVRGGCKGHYPAQALVCGYIDGGLQYARNQPTPTRTPPPWWQFWVHKETPIPTRTPLPW